MKEPEPDEFDDMNMEQLKREMITSRAKLKEIRRNRNYYLQERNQFAEFNSLVHQEVVNTRAHIRNIEAQMERMQETHRADIKIYLQKVIHLEYEQANNVDQVEADAFKAREADEKQHLMKKDELKRQKMLLKKEIRELEQKYEADIAALQDTENNILDKLKKGFEVNYREMIQHSEDRLRELKEDMELRRKMEIHEIEERKNRHICDLLFNHEKAFSLMRQYYNSITRDNLSLIRALNDEIAELSDIKDHHQKEKEIYEKKNGPLNEDLEQKKKDVAELQAKLKNFLKQKASLAHAEAGLKVMEEQYEDLTQQHAGLRNNFSMLQKERDHLYQTFEETVLSVRGRSERRNDRLAQVLEEKKDQFEAKMAQFTAVLRQSNLDPTILHNVTQKLDDVLTSKNEQVKELKYECAKVTKAHNDLVRVYEDKLREFGIPESELDLEPLIELDANNRGIAGAGSVPAGLIVG